MEMSIPDIETEYGLRPRSIIKSKYFYIIAVGGAIYRLYPFSQSETAAERLYEMNAAALAAGTAVCPMLKTSSGKVCSSAEEELFFLASVPKGREPEPDGEEFLKAIELMSKLHRVLRTCEPPEEENELPYTKGIQTLKYIRGIVNRKNKCSEIDKLFLENYEMMLCLAENAADTIEKSGLKCTCCYGTPKEENFILTRSGEICLANWTGIKVSHFLSDLAYMIKRYDKKSVKRDIPREKIIERYCICNPLSENELLALKSILNCPEKYILILKEYYGRHRPFAPLYVKEKLMKEINAAKVAYKGI